MSSKDTWSLINNFLSNAIEVIAGVMPIRHRLQEQCMGEYCKIMARHEKDCHA